MLDFAWPSGLQATSSQPVAGLRNEDAADITLMVQSRDRCLVDSWAFPRNVGAEHLASGNGSWPGGLSDGAAIPEGGHSVRMPGGCRCHRVATSGAT